MLDWIIALYLPLTCLTQGQALGPATVTLAAALCVIGCVLTCVQRIREARPIASLRVLRDPAVFCCLAYFAVGVGSGFCAADKDSFMKEVVQRTLIILMPLYLYLFGPKHPRALIRALLCYIPVASAIAAATFVVALKSGLHQAVYLFGMHKNAVGGDCAHLALICSALLITKQFPQHRNLILSVVILGFMGMIGAQSRAALTGTVLGIFLMMIASRARIRYVAAFAVFIICAYGGTMAILPKDAIEHVTTTERFSSNAVRQYTWQVMSERLTKDPLICVGWGNPLYKNLDLSSDFAAGKGMLVSDCANIFFYDWFQMGILGVLTQLAMFGSCLLLPFLNARRCPSVSPLAAINLAALGIMAARFEQSYLDSFWIGRGPTLAAWAAVGMAVYVKLWLNQSAEVKRLKRINSAISQITN